jgi:hypothetical protein
MTTQTRNSHEDEKESMMILPGAAVGGIFIELKDESSIPFPWES